MKYRRLMKNRLLILLARMNFIFPFYLGFEFRKYYRFLKSNYSQYDNTLEVIKVVNNSIQSIPFYQKLNLPFIKSIIEFQNQIPIIDKDLIMNYWEDFLLPNYPKTKTFDGTTGGTSGKPLRLIIPKKRHIVELNTMNSMWQNIGWKGEIRAVIRNKHLRSDQVFIVNPIKKEIIFDGFNTEISYYEKIYESLIQFKIKFIHAYPSSAYQFSLFLKHTNKDTSFIKGFLCGSEGLTELQRDLITRELKILVYNWYGHSEKLIIGGPCKNNSAIHIEPTYGYFELLDVHNKPIKNPGQVGEIVGTGIHNSYMSFLRYRTGDFAEYVGDYCEHCKRYLPLIKNVQGRWSDNKIFLNDGSYVSITALNLHSDLYLYIEGMQYIQKEKGILEILLVKGNNYSLETENRFKDHFNKSLQGKCFYQISYTNQVIKEKNGKFLPLKQNIK
jgi:phenylacetate-CoA ligase